MSADADLPRPPGPKPRGFASFANADFRIFFLCATSAMMADNIEHVISYWVMFQKFHSPALGAFAVVSHWVPYLAFAGFTGRLADRFDIRRLIQTGMAMYFGVSVCWGTMFMTDSVAVWKAMALLIIHGLAGVLWLPASQVLIHRMVTVEQLPSAVRLTATGRYLGFLVGPLLGNALMQLFGPSLGIYINALIYVPFFIWLINVPFGNERGAAVPAGRRINGFADVWNTMKVVARQPVLLSMTVLIAASAFFVGNAYQAQMPGFAEDLGHGDAGFSYGLLVAADAGGGLAAGAILESRGLLPPAVRTAFVLAMIWCVALIGFAQSKTYLFAVIFLLVAGFVELAFNAMAQALVQLNAPDDMRGRVIGVFSMFAMGMRAFSGLCVGLLGSLIGIHNSLSFAALALLLVYVAMFGARVIRRR